MTAQARILFVDDERRVLTSMRAMFRRDYEVHLANSGAEALELMRQHEFDVVVSDQRMPEMTGVEILREARSIAPKSMRILLTGYADLEAIETAINESEVFRYLMKPCPREQLKETVALAVDAVRGMSGAGDEDAAEAAAGGDSTAPKSAVAAVDLMVLSEDGELLQDVRQAVEDRWQVHHAASLADAIRLLAERPVGVLITDAAVDEAAVSALTSELKQHVPELVTIVASQRSDAHMLINLINHGQVFRFLLKPVSVGQCRLWLSSAVSRHAELVTHPEAVQRYKVTGSTAAVREGALLSGVVEGVRRLRSRVLGLGGPAG
ncbi:MAG: response regulator [Gammaproteobacteria bacterium]|nr:MAG: response regulator [Gammaproteobacteria bacterium]